MSPRNAFAGVSVVKMALGLAAALAAMFALMAITAAPSHATAKSKTCSGIANCNTVIDVGGVEIDINADRVLSDIEVANVEDITIKILNGSDCNVITVLCQDKIKLFLLNNVLVWAKAPITVFVIKVIKL